MASPRDVDAVLRERARALAQPADDARAHATVALAAFRIGGHAIAVPLASVARASELRHLTEIPGGPSYLLGVTAIDGKLVSLLDLTALYGLRGRGVGDVTGTLLVAAGKREIALAAEQLIGIEDVPLDTIQPLPGARGALDKLALVDAQPLLVLDVEALFADARLGAR